MISVVPLAERDDAAGCGDADDLRVGDVVLDVAGQVLEAAAGQVGGDDELLGVVAVLEGDLFWGDGEGLDFGGLGQDERFLFGTILVAVEVSGGEKSGRPGEGRADEQR